MALIYFSYFTYLENSFVGNMCWINPLINIAVCMCIEEYTHSHIIMVNSDSFLNTSSDKYLLWLEKLQTNDP